MANIDNLVIKIEADSKDAIKAINDVSNALKNLGKLPELKAFKTLTGTMKEITKQNEAYAKSLVAESKIMSAQSKIAEAKAKAELVQSKIEQTNARTAQIKARTEQANIKAEQTKQKIAEQTENKNIDYTKRNEIDDATGVTENVKNRKAQRLLNKQIAEQMRARYAVKDALEKAQSKVTEKRINELNENPDTKGINNPKNGTVSEDVVREPQLENNIEETNSDSLPKKASQIDDIRSRLDRLRESVKSTNKEVKTVHKSSNSLFGRIKRIIGYRLIRGAFNQVISGIREGIQNLVLFEKYISNSSLTKATEIMNSLATSLQTLKNSFGSATVAILGAFKPALESLMNMLANVANTVNQFIVAIQGGNTWMKATDAAYDYSKSLQSVKKQTFGFDELNILNGSGTNAGGTSYAEMFESTGISEKIQKIADTVRPLITFVKENIEAVIGTVAAGWLLLKKYGILTALGSLITSIKSAGLAVASLSGACTALGLAGIGTIISGITDFVKTGEIGEKSLAKLELGIAAVSVALIPLTGGWSLLGGVIAAVIPIIIKHFGSFKTAFKSVKTAVETYIGNIKDGIESGRKAFLYVVNSICGYFDTLVTKFTSVINSLKLKWNEFALLINESDIAKSLGIEIPIFEEYKSLHKSAAGVLHTGGGRSFASGGMPSYGSMFIAGEQGSSAEIVGQFGGRTNVINQEQLTYSMREANRETVNAIYAMANAIVNSVDNIEMPSIRIGDREIYNASQRGKKIVGSSLVQGV